MHGNHPPEAEIPLRGGRYMANVMRVGDTVCRPALPSSPFVARLLKHLQARGFEGVPRHLGRDGKGRERFSYIPGVVHERWQYFPDEAVRAAGRWLRAFHDATRGSDLVGDKSVVCHNDPGSNNAVFRDGALVAFIDFDMAAPGEAIEDIGYMAWSWCVASKSSRQPISIQAAQVRVLADAYGLEGSARAGIVPAITARQSRNVQFWTGRKSEPPHASLLPVSKERIDEIVAW